MNGERRRSSMNNDLISREETLNALRARGRELLKLGTSFEFNIANITALECVNIVKDVPAVDAEPVRRGEWLIRNIVIDNNGMTAPDWPKCSECGGMNDVESKFCPNCGAKMEEDTE